MKIIGFGKKETHAYVSRESKSVQPNPPQSFDGTPETGL